MRSGPFFKALEEQIYQNPWFIKHVPVPERPSLIKNLYQAGLRFYENDFKSFESHFRAELMGACECLLYRHAFQRHPKVADMICKTISGVNRIKTRCGLRCAVNARRMSGDMCTSLGNGFTNLMVVLYIVHKKGGQVRGFVEGDDGLFASTVPITKTDYANVGFEVEIHELDHPCHGHFCGMLCTLQGEVIKDPRRVFRGFFFTHSCIHAGWRVTDQLLRARALSLAYELPQCPILGVLARKVLHLTEGIEARVDQKEWKKIPASFSGPTGPFAPSDEARLLFEQKFGIPIAAQLRAERAILQWDLGTVAECVPPLRDNTGFSADLWYETRYLEVT